MRILIAEDDPASRNFLHKFLSRYSVCEAVADGVEALNAFIAANDEGKPYELICLDIMMPKMDGVRVLKAVRNIERQSNAENRVKVIMTTALLETPFIHNSFDIGCDAYAVKPIDLERFMDVLKEIGCSLDNR